MVVLQDTEERQQTHRIIHRSEDDLIPPVRRYRNHHSLACQVPIANTDIYKCICLSHTSRDWNALPDSLISSAEGAEDSVAKFTYRVRARD